MFKYQYSEFLLQKYSLYLAFVIKYGYIILPGLAINELERELW